MRKLFIALFGLALLGAGCTGSVKPGTDDGGTTDGDTTTVDNGNLDEKADLIRVDAPTPNSVVTSPLTITGEARGTFSRRIDSPC